MISKNSIPIDEIIARAKIQLRVGNTSEHDDYLEIMISEGLRHLDAITLYEKRQCNIDIVDNKAELPKGFQKLLGMRFIKTTLETQIINGVPTQVPVPSCSTVFYVDTKFLNDCDCGNLFPFALNYSQTAQIVNGIIHFNSGNIESGVLQVAYMGLNTDKNGRILIYEEYERALSAYACYMFTMAYSEEKSIGLADRYYETWKAQKAWIKGGAWKDEFARTKMEISATINALVVDQTVNWQ
jgi:hypothetical protein